MLHRQAQLVIPAGGCGGCQLRSSACDKFYYMAEPIFTRQIYPHNQYLNPSRRKLAARHNKSPPKPAHHHRTLSLSSHTQPNCHCPCAHPDALRDVREVLTGHSAILKQIRHRLSAETPHPIPHHKLELLQQKNEQLHNELKLKDQRMDSLRERYEELLIKFESLSCQSKVTSINTSFDSNTNRSVSHSRRSDILRELRSLKERLRAINFSEVLGSINRIGPHSPH